ncbi:MULTISPECIES: ABC transporter permease [Hyphomicrobiales]|uniref:Permease component of ABC transporter n=3 Tax=Brucella/Ochrobactrum group TaxID=2826938 RepID=A6X840_BRUA4|nr:MULTISPECIES: ABC transporter permease [Hyphomicrobiales]ABS17394.1 putative permease component of ABC transporter [Brucella anthropi ATCC 49188]AIH15745.1 hypothetical protein [Ochrobactrum sp. SJY1]QQC28790.1 ABC transporter permease [Brucella anthropi]CDN96309.1 Putative permease component of ABC transporter [Agrobacterium tumefaciens]
MSAAHLPPGFRRIFRRELRQIAKRPALFFMLGPFPLLLFLILAAIFHAGLPTALPVAVIDEDGTAMSRQIVRMIDATPEVEVAGRLVNLTEGREAVLDGRIYAAVLIPSGLERDLLLGRRPEVVVFYNNQLMTPGGIAARAINGALNTFSAGLAVEMRIARGATREAAIEAAAPVPLRQSPLFNPTLDYVQFLLAAIMPTVLQIFICAGAVLSFSRDRHTKAGIARVLRLGKTPLRATAGKLLPYTFTYGLTLIAADAIIFGFFGAPFHGSMLLHVVSGFAFILASQLLGVLLALSLADTVAALGLCGLLTGPAFGFAGVSFPRIVMNGFSVAWGAILPLTPYLQLRTDQALRGTPVEISLPTLGWLLALLAVYGLLTLLQFRRTARPAVRVKAEPPVGETP